MAKKTSRTWFFVSIGIALFIFQLPLLFSVPPGKNLVLHLLKKEKGESIAIDNLRLRWAGPQTFKNIAIKESHFTLEGESLTLDRPLWQMLNIKDHLLSAKGIIEGKNFSLATTANHSKIFDTNGKIQFLPEKDKLELTLDGKTKKDNDLGSFRCTGKIAATSFWKNLDNPLLWDISLQGYFQKFPVNLLDIIFQHVEGLSLFPNNEVLQEFVDVQIQLAYAHSQGNLDIDLTSKTQSLSAQVQFSETQIDLKKPLSLSFYLTDKMTDLIRKKHPDFPIHKTNTPIFLRVDSQGFYFPIRPLNPSIVQVKNAYLDLGQMVIDSLPALDPLFDFMKTNKPEKTLTVWVTPVNIQMDNEMITLDRIDALIENSIHICLWGSIDVKTKKLYMTLGIPAETLSQISSAINVSDDYVLQLPMRGTWDHVKVDTSNAKKLVSQMVSKQIQSLSSASPWGALLGGAMSMSSPEGEKAPPAKKPFPWENGVSPAPKKQKKTSPPQVPNIPFF